MSDSVWISEVGGGYGNTIETTGHLYSHRSKYQQIDIHETRKLGKLLMLDGIIQLTSYDEFVYHEMLANLPFYAYKNGTPRRALVIGGGDGGVLRELSRHPELEVIDICEIDADVIEAAKKYLPETSCGYLDKRVSIHIGDGSKFIEEKKNYYDIVIVDSTDPGGPGEPLFNGEFYTGIKAALREGGVVTSQGESAFLLPDIVARLNRITGKVFKYSGYATLHVPTYPTGVIGACVASDFAEVTTPAREVEPELQKVLRYYNSEIHTACFVQPNFVRALFK